MFKNQNHLPLGAVKEDDGTIIIPENQRPDGTIRKAVRIRSGYIPPDEQTAYRTPQQRKREENKTRSNTPIILHQDTPKELAKASVIHAMENGHREMSKVQKKNEVSKKTIQRKQKSDQDVSDLTNKMEKVVIDKKDILSAEEKQKEIKKIQKKIKQINLLKQKNEEGSISLNLDQRNKIHKLHELVNELTKLETGLQ